MEAESGMKRNLEDIHLSSNQKKLTNDVEKKLEELFPDDQFMRSLCRQLGFVWALQELLKSVIKIESVRHGLSPPFTDAVKDLSEGMKMEACTVVAFYVHPMKDVAEEKKQELMVKASEAIILVAEAANSIVAEELTGALVRGFTKEGGNNAKES